MLDQSGVLDLGGRIALVTGAGQGVGRQIALQLAAHSARVVVNDYFLDRAEEVAEEITAAGGEAMSVAADVTDLNSVRQMVETSHAHWGEHLSVLVNNAGNYGANPSEEARAPFWTTSPETWQQAIGVNFFGVMNTAAATVPGMIESGQPGRIITIISDAARYGDAGMEIYAGAKAGAAGFMRSLARTLGRHQITANCVSISGMNTPRVAALLEANPEMRKKALDKYIIRRLGEPSDVANMVLFLASDASSWITGQTYPVNGGFTLSL